MTFDFGNPVGDAAWAPYSATVFAAATNDGKVGIVLSGWKTWTRVGAAGSYDLVSIPLCACDPCHLPS
jgi:hypothetical protein